MIEKISGPCGCHKTTAAMHYCAYGVRAGERFIFAQPTIELLEQSYRRFRGKYPDTNCAQIHASSMRVYRDGHETVSHCQNVAVALRELSLECVKYGVAIVVFVTHTGLLQTPWIASHDKWRVIFDETPSPVWSVKFDLYRNADKILPFLEVVREHDRYFEISFNDDYQDQIVSIAHDGPHGVYSESIKDLARKLLSGQWHIYVLQTQWPNPKELLMFGLLDPKIFSGYHEMTVMSANLDDTIFAQYAEANCIRMRNHRKGILDRLAFQQHQNGELLDIYYGFQQNWSKRLRDRKIGGKSVNTMLVESITELFGNETYAKLFNKDLSKHDPFGSNGELLPHLSHGLNHFQHLHNAAIIPALSATPAFYRFLEEVGHLDPDRVSRAIYCEQVYQAVMRISLRNPTDPSLCKVAVPDYRAGAYLHKLFPGSRLHLLDSPDTAAIATSTKYATQEERDYARRKQNADSVRRNRWRTRTREASLLLESYMLASRQSPSSPIDLPHKAKSGTRTRKAKLLLESYMLALRQSRPSPIDLPCKAKSGVGFAISHWDSRAATPEPDYAGDAYEITYPHHLIAQRTYTTDEFFEFIQTCAATRTHADKYDNDMFMPSHVNLKKDPGRGHTKRNHVVSQGIVLDIEHSDLTPDDIHAALPYRMITYTSFGDKQENRRYRICIPTEPMSYDASEACRRMCVRKLEEAYPTRKSGVDMSKMNAVALFFLPCIRTRNNTVKPCEVQVYDGEAFDHVAWIEACPHDIVDACLRLSPNTPEPEPDEVAQPPALAVETAMNDPDEEVRHKRNIVNRAIRTWRERGSYKGTGRQQFWSLYRSLKDRAELSPLEIRAILEAEAQYAHNPQERHGEIDPLLRSG